jgi:hypothetical protein
MQYKLESAPSEAGLRLDAHATLDWLNKRKGKTNTSRLLCNDHSTLYKSI